MEAFALNTGAPKVYWDDNKICISVFEAKIVTHRVKHIDIPVCFLQEKFDNGLFLPKCENSSVLQLYVHQTLIRSNNQSEYKMYDRFRFYPTSEI